MDRPDTGRVIRQARLLKGWTQEQFGNQIGYTKAWVSRAETGRKPIVELPILRRIAAVLDIPPEALGLADRVPTLPVSPDTTLEDDSVDRRAFLSTAGILGASAVLPAVTTEPDPAALVERRIAGALLSPAAGTELPDQEVLDQTLAAATDAFDACHYVRLANLLPGLINAASALDTMPSGAAFATEVYLLCGNALGKILVSGFQPLASDRAARAAENSGDPMLMAAAWRHVSGSARRFGNYDAAVDVGIRAVEALPINSSTPDRLRRRIAELWNATGYTAAQRGDADRSAECYREAHRVISTIRDPELQRKGEDAAAANQISAAFKLEDPALALSSASRVQVTALPTVERAGRYLVDVAMAWHQHGDPIRSYRALVTAESYAPGEVRTRTASRQLIASLAASPRRGMTDIAGLARRARVAL